MLLKTYARARNALRSRESELIGQDYAVRAYWSQMLAFEGDYPSPPGVSLSTRRAARLAEAEARRHFLAKIRFSRDRAWCDLHRRFMSAQQNWEDFVDASLIR